MARAWDSEARNRPSVNLPIDAGQNRITSAPMARYSVGEMASKEDEASPPLEKSLHDQIQVVFKARDLRGSFINLPLIKTYITPEC